MLTFSSTNNVWTRTHTVKNEHGIPLRFNENVNARHEYV